MSQKGTYCFLINCASNAFQAEDLFRKKEQYLLSEFPGSELVYIRAGESIQDMAALKAKEFSYIVACGGDGTVNRTANGLIGSTATLGVIPLGSGNDFAKNIGLEYDLEQNIRTLKEDQVQTIDIVKSDWGYFLNTFGIGIDGLTNYYASRSKSKYAFMRYFFGGLKALFSTESFEMTLHLKENSKEHIRQRVWMVAVANGKTEGGKYTISPDSLCNDGQVEVIVVKDVSRMRLLIEFLKLSLGFTFKEEVIDVYKMRSGVFSIEPENRVKAHADGEQVEGINSYHFNLLPSVLPVVINVRKQ